LPFATAGICRNASAIPPELQPTLAAWAVIMIAIEFLPHGKSADAPPPREP
jgi:hypothetical protein